MTHKTNAISQLGSKPFITDGGLETTLIFENGIDLPEFAAFPLLFTHEGKETLRNYFIKYIEIAKAREVGFILETPTYRASGDWGKKLGYTSEDIAKANSLSIEMMTTFRNSYADSTHPMIISGCIGPRGDGYHIDKRQSAEEARAYHFAQIATFKQSGADLVSAFTLNYTEEAIGIILAAQECEIPVVISFTVETDGRLPSGQPLGAAIEETDRKTGRGPLYYMINCAHPTHFEHVLDSGEEWTSRIHAVRANASCKSHAELEEAEGLDPGNPVELVSDYARLQKTLTNLSIFGGCCGTDHTHLAAICESISLH